MNFFPHPDLRDKATIFIRHFTLIRLEKMAAKKTLLAFSLGLLVFVAGLILCCVPIEEEAFASVWETSPPGFVHGIALSVDGETFYFEGPGSAENFIDIPGHKWMMENLYEVSGKHYNVGPEPRGHWWASGVPYGFLLYDVHGIIAPKELPQGIALNLKKQGYVHRHELVDKDGNENTIMAVYLRYSALRMFHLDGGPGTPETDHDVSIGIDYDFMPNW